MVATVLAILAGLADVTLVLGDECFAQREVAFDRLTTPHGAGECSNSEVYM